MTTSSAMARELSVLLGARIGSAEVPHVWVLMWADPLGGWRMRAMHREDEVPFWCATWDLSEPWEIFSSRILFPVADILARKHHQRVTAHIRAGLNPYRPGKMAEVRKPRRLKNARTSPGPWSEPRKLRPFELYRQGREIRVAPEEMPLPDGAQFLPPADAARHHYVNSTIYGPEWAADMERTKQATGIYLAGRAPSYASQQAAPADYSGHRFDPEAISRAVGAGMQDAGAGVPGAFQIVGDDDQPWPARRRPPLWAWILLAVGVLAALFRIVVLCIAP